MFFGFLKSNKVLCIPETPPPHVRSSMSAASEAAKGSLMATNSDDVHRACMKKRLMTRCTFAWISYMKLEFLAYQERRLEAQSSFPGPQSRALGLRRFLWVETVVFFRTTPLFFLVKKRHLCSSFSRNAVFATGQNRCPPAISRSTTKQAQQHWHLPLMFWQRKTSQNQRRRRGRKRGGEAAGARCPSIEMATICKSVAAKLFPQNWFCVSFSHV